MTLEFFDGVPVLTTNEIPVDTPKYHISYNWSCSPYGCPTTAMYIKDTSQFLILQGDHTKEYEDLDFEQSLKYFYDNVHLAVKQSEHGKIFTAKDDQFMYVEGGY